MTEQVISQLRRRMIEDMTMRKLAAKTQHDYVQRIKEFAVFLGRSPDTARTEDVRRFQLHLASSGANTPKINATISALRFFFNVTLGRADLGRPLASLRQERKAPVILSPEEVARFLEAAPSLKYKAALSVAYGAGLRVSEVVTLKLVAPRPRHSPPPGSNNQAKTAKNRSAQSQMSHSRDRPRRSALFSATPPKRYCLAGTALIPIAQAVPPQSVSRGFLPWRLSDAGRQRTPPAIPRGRHPKPFTLASVGTDIAIGRNVPKASI